MQSISLNTEEMDWVSGAPFYGPDAVFDGREVVQLKVLSDRRAEGGGIAWLVRFTPPEAKVIRIVAVALSDWGLKVGAERSRVNGCAPRATMGSIRRASRTARSLARKRCRW